MGVGLLAEMERVVKVLMSRMQRPTKSTSYRTGNMLRNTTCYKLCTDKFLRSKFSKECSPQLPTTAQKTWASLCHLSSDATFLDLSVDESGADEADEAAHGGSSQPQNSFH